MQPKTPVRPAAVFNSSTRLGSYGSDMQSIEQELAPLRERLINHEIYERLGSEQVMKRFMEHHIFAVWDFMSLVKTLAQTGFRKIEISVDKAGDPCDANCLSRKALRWRLRGRIYESGNVPRSSEKKPR